MQGLHLKSTKVFFTFALSLLLTFSVFGRTGNNFERDYLILKKIAADYRSFGSICEQVARLRLKETFDPKKFNFLVGLEYRNSLRVLGEIDLIVFSKKDGRVVVVGEVKCWKNLNAAMKKAEKQLNRFFKSMKGEKKVFFYPKERVNIKFEKKAFMNAKKMYFSQKTQKISPFKNDIGLTLLEVKKLREKLQTCQRNKECPTIK